MTRRKSDVGKMIIKTTGRDLSMSDKSPIKLKDLTSLDKQHGVDAFIYLGNMRLFYEKMGYPELAEPYEELVDILAQGEKNLILLESFKRSPNRCINPDLRMKSSNPYGNMRQLASKRGAKLFGVNWYTRIGNLVDDIEFLIDVAKGQYYFELAPKEGVTEESWKMGYDYVRELMLEFENIESKGGNPFAREYKLNLLFKDLLNMVDKGQNINIEILRMIAE